MAADPAPRRAPPPVRPLLLTGRLAGPPVCAPARSPVRTLDDAQLALPLTRPTRPGEVTP